MLQKLKNLGPGLLVAAAFIGPGTVTTASVVGADTGYALVWALAFSIFATIVLQEMSARLGIVSRAGLGEALRTTFNSPLFRWLSVALVLVAIGFGTAAFQTGNIAGAALGLETILGLTPGVWVLLVGAIAFALLASGTYRLIERVLMVLVGVMSVVFIVTAIVVRPDLGGLLTGLLTPRIPDGAVLQVIALVGTTVVTYNFFLHSAAVQDRWPQTLPVSQSLSESRFDTVVSILLGGAITLAILVTSSAAFSGTDIVIENAGQMAEQLEPVLGPAAKWFFGLGLFAAGLTSSVTAPLAAAYATSGALGWQRDLKSWKFRAVWALVVIVGTTLAYTGTSPVEAILLAQAANGILLPLVAVFLLIVMNRPDLLGEHVNGLAGNILGGIVMLVAGFLGGYSLLKVLGFINV